MKSILCVSLLILLMPSAYAAELPGDSADGKRLHDANCMGCHDTGIHTREDHFVQSLDALKKQVSMQLLAPSCEERKIEKSLSESHRSSRRFPDLESVRALSSSKS